MSTLERITGGVTLFLHCPGFQIPGPIRLDPDDFCIELYSSPRERVSGGPELSDNVALLVQGFMEKIAPVHLVNFQYRCEANAVTPPPAPCTYFD
jgi:hypothetical protein